jgi:carboxypeptidase Taq
LPAAWNEKIKKYLNLDVPSDDLGVLQDVHWSHGSIGYFPTYTLGNVYAAQLFKTAEQQIPAMKAEFAKGNFRPYLDWLRQNIHSQGRRYQPDELITKVTGEAPNSAYLLEHLKSKLELTN